MCETSLTSTYCGGMRGWARANTTARWATCILACIIPRSHARKVKGADEEIISFHGDDHLESV